MIKNFIERAKRGESIYISEIRDAFISGEALIECAVETATDETHHWTIQLPHARCYQDREFIRDYFYSNIFNIISTFGGKRMIIGIVNGNDHIQELFASLNDVFQVGVPRPDRSGYGKCLNVTDRVNAAMGCKPFRFEIIKGGLNKSSSRPEKQKDAVSVFRQTVLTAGKAVLIGLDIGGSDIKAVGTINNRIITLKEYDWNPAAMTKVEQITDAVNMVVKEVCAAFGEAVLPDGIGVGYPDVVIMDRIVGGETLKTRGIRLASPDYEGEFAGLYDLNELLLSHCKPGGVVSMTNDGFLAAYTAAVELANSDRSGEIADGILAHTLGTELGTGWINESGEIPQIPLEIYACVIDMGNYPAREFEPFDLRSTINFNNDLAGTMQKYACQSGAYRLALEYFKEDAKDEYHELWRKGFIEEKDGGLYVKISPEDMRKPFLTHIMSLADRGQPQAERIFREIGKYLAATWRETEFLLSPKVRQRIIYGRFVKSLKCLKLMQEGAREILEITLKAGDDSLAFTPLMQELKDNRAYTVAQFGQAVGAVHFAAAKLQP